MSNLEGHSALFIIGYMVQDMRAELIDDMKRDPETGVWSVNFNIVENHLDKIMEYILNLPTMEDAL